MNAAQTQPRFTLTTGMPEHTTEFAWKGRFFVGEMVLIGRHGGAYVQRYRVEAIDLEEGQAQLRAVFFESVGPDTDGHFRTQAYYLDGTEVQCH